MKREFTNLPDRSSFDTDTAKANVRVFLTFGLSMAVIFAGSLLALMVTIPVKQERLATALVTSTPARSASVPELANNDLSPQFDSGLLSGE